MCMLHTTRYMLRATRYLAGARTCGVIFLSVDPFLQPPHPPFFRNDRLFCFFFFIVNQAIYRAVGWEKYKEILWVTTVFFPPLN